jgi:hypothetical protein
MPASAVRTARSTARSTAHPILHSSRHNEELFVACNIIQVETMGRAVQRL